MAQKPGLQRVFVVTMIIVPGYLRKEGTWSTFLQFETYVQVLATY